jgi:predicted phage terminase large subunit-like protein
MPAHPERAATIDGLTPAEIAEIETIDAELAGGGESLIEFIERIAPDHAPVPRHLLPLIKVIERARRERVKVCLSMPPGHAKTLTLLRGIAWWLAATPSDTCAYLSYADRQAWGKSKIGRDIAEEAGVELNPYAWSGAEWRTTDGGGVLAAGVDGRLTGNRITGLCVFDDPFKSRDDANSPASRESVWSFYTTVVRLRMENASIVVVQTRWHQDDLIGRLARKGGWEVINLPALAEPNDSLGREPGEALWPEMYDEREFAEIREEIGEFDFGALYQGRPIPRGATLFGLEHYYDQEKVDLTGCKIIMACDEAASDDTVADNSTIVVMAMKGRGIETIAYILDVYCEQVTIPQFARDLRAWQVRWGNPRCGVESNGAFKAVPQLLKEADASLRIKEIVALVDKFQRAQSVSAAWNNARVLVPLPTASRPVPWLKRFLGEVSVFTGVSDAHDDQVDALAHAWNMAYQPGATGGATKRDGAILPRRI